MVINPSNNQPLILWWTTLNDRSGSIPGEKEIIKHLGDLTRIRLKASPEIWIQEIIRKNRAQNILIIYGQIPWAKQHKSVSDFQ